MMPAKLLGLSAFAAGFLIASGLQVTRVAIDMRCQYSVWVDDCWR